MKHHHIVIMAGGIGSRFWPMSTPTYPKQFIDVMGVGKSLIQLTVDRFGGICPPENFWVVTSETYKDIVRKQLPDIPEQHILTEPEARNTAPCAYSGGYPFSISGNIRSFLRRYPIFRSNRIRIPGG